MTPKGPNEGQKTPSLKTSSTPAWVAKCTSESRKGPVACSVEETLILANTGQAVASVIVQVQSSAQQPVMLIRIPVGIYLPAGVIFQIDEGAPKSIPLQTCDGQGCYAEMQISSNVIAALKGGKRFSVSFQNLAKNKIVLPMVIDNFAEVFQKIQ